MPFLPFFLDNQGDFLYREHMVVPTPYGTVSPDEMQRFLQYLAQLREGKAAAPANKPAHAENKKKTPAHKKHPATR